MFTEVTYYLIFGKPLIMYMGILTLSSFLFTALIGFLNLRGYTIIPLQYHFMMAKISLSLAIIHGTLGILAYF